MMYMMYPIRNNERNDMHHENDFEPTKVRWYPLLAQVVGAGLVSEKTVMEVIDHPLFAQASEHFLRPMKIWADSGLASRDNPLD